MSCQEQCEKQQQQKNLFGAPSPLLSDSVTRLSTLFCPLRFIWLVWTHLWPLIKLPRGLKKALLQRVRGTRASEDSAPQYWQSWGALLEAGDKIRVKGQQKLQQV